MEDEPAVTNRRLMAAFVRAPAAAPLAEDVVLEDVAQRRTCLGRDEAAGLLRAFFVEGFPAAQIEAEQLLADGEAAMLQFTFCGRQEGPFLGIPPTGRPVAVPMVLVCQIRDGRIQRAVLYYDAGRLLRQLGLAL